MPASTENNDADAASPVRSATMPVPAAGAPSAPPALSSSPNTSKSRFANAGAQDSLGALGAGLGTKSMPGSRRTSAIPGSSDDSGAFGLDKLSLGDNKVEDANVSHELSFTECTLTPAVGQGKLCDERTA